MLMDEGENDEKQELLYFCRGRSHVISKQIGSESAFITFQVDFHTAQDKGLRYFLQRRTSIFNSL